MSTNETMPSPQKFRRLVLTAAVTSITIAGSLYGAELKTNEEIAEVSNTGLPWSSDSVYATFTCKLSTF